MSKKVFISHCSPSYKTMMKSDGWEVTENISEADLVMFTGGPDVDPGLYNQYCHPENKLDLERDADDVLAYDQAQEMGVPCVGICRGAQLLHVMNGGKLIQHVDNHREPHFTKIFGLPKKLMVTSTHHQMMFPQPLTDGIVVMSNSSITDVKESMTQAGTKFLHNNMLEDVEGIYYPYTDCLCFQPHPEIDLKGDTHKAFLYLMRNYLFGKGEEYSSLEDDLPF